MDPLTQLSFDPRQFTHTLPIALPALAGLAVLCGDVFLKPGRGKSALAAATALTGVLAAVLALALWTGDAHRVVLGGQLGVSALPGALALTIVLATVITAFSAVHHGQPFGGAPAPGTIAHGELYGLLLFAAAGMLALVAANDLVTFFVALETLSIAVYALTGIERRRARAAEGALKYFVLGAFSSGFLLYGMALIYGATGTLRLDEVARLDLAGNARMATTGAVLLFSGLLFKLAAVPFHAWSPDAYEGAPSPVTGFMSVGVKAAAFGGALHVVAALGQAGALGGGVAWTLWLVAALTVIVGNAGALTQRNPRRLLAYSSVAHTGYALIGLVALARAYDPEHPLAGPGMVETGRDAAAGIVYYVLGYGVANLAAFGVLCHLERDGRDIDDIDELAGLAQRQPGMALAMTLAMLSLAGLPGTAGFLGKLWVFRAGVAAGDVGLVVLALLTSALSLYYYLGVVVTMYMRQPAAASAEAAAPDRLTPDPGRWGTKLAVVVAAVAVVLLGVYPGQGLLGLVVDGARALL